MEESSLKPGDYVIRAHADSIKDIKRGELCKVVFPKGISTLLNTEIYLEGLEGSFDPTYFVKAAINETFEVQEERKIKFEIFGE
jgi:hypothetical protein